MSTLNLPDGWFEYLDNASGKPYFFNPASNTTTWDRPAITAPVVTKKVAEAKTLRADMPQTHQSLGGSSGGLAGGLLSQIKDGAKLKKVVTKDASAAVSSSPSAQSGGGNSLFSEMMATKLKKTNTTPNAASSSPLQSSYAAPAAKGAGFADIMRKNRESAAAKASIHGSPNSHNANSSSGASTTQTMAYAATYTGSNSGHGNDKYGSPNISNSNGYSSNRINNNSDNNNNSNSRSSSSSNGYRADPGSTPIPASVGSGTECPIRTRAIPGVRESRSGTGSGSGSIKSPHFSSPSRLSPSGGGGEERPYDGHLGGPKQTGSGSQSVFGIASDGTGGQGQGRSQSRGARSTHESPTNAEIAGRLISIEHKLDRLLKHLGI